MQENTTDQGNAAAHSKVDTTDLLLVAAVLVECAFLYICLTTKQSFIGYFLPVVVCMVSVTLTVLSLRDIFWRTGTNKNS